MRPKAPDHQEEDLHDDGRLPCRYDSDNDGWCPWHGNHEEKS